MTIKNLNKTICKLVGSRGFQFAMLLSWHLQRAYVHTPQVTASAVSTRLPLWLPVILTPAPSSSTPSVPWWVSSAASRSIPSGRRAIPTPARPPRHGSVPVSFSSWQPQSSARSSSNSTTWPSMLSTKV